MGAPADIEQQQEDFEIWVFEMEDRLEQFVASFPPEIRTALDYSPESLDHLESWLLESYATVDDAAQQSAKVPLDGAARYIGETFRRNLGGTWEIRFDDPSYAYYGVPQLENMPHVLVDVCPLFMATTAIDRRRGDLLSKNLLRKKKAQAEATA